MLGNVIGEAIRKDSMCSQKHGEYIPARAFAGFQLPTLQESMASFVILYDRP